MKNLKAAILKIAKENPNGFTIELPTLKKVTSGVVSAYKDTQNCFGEQGLEKVLEHAENNSKVVGGWLNYENGKYYFDSSKVFFDKDEAMKFGRENEQIAIFDIDDLRVIKL